MEKIKIKKIIFLLGSGFFLFFLFAPIILPENFHFQEILTLAKNADVIIIFNSGGFGNTPLEEAKDFASIIEGIQKTLNEWGYQSIILEYHRTKNNFLGKIGGIKDFLNSFKFSSKDLAEKIEFLNKNLPDKKIILTGFSAGGAFVEETVKKISLNSQVFAIGAGVPFWFKKQKLENILFLDNGKKDILAIGDIRKFIISLIKIPIKWVLVKLNNQQIKISQISQDLFNHQYFWSTPETTNKIITFLENKLR